MQQTVEWCPVEAAIQIIGGKWKMLVLRSLLLNGPQRYNELLATVTAISPKELTRNLRELTEARLVIIRSVTARPTSEVPEAKPVARYELTSLGSGLMPTFTSLLEWGANLRPAN